MSYQINNNCPGWEKQHGLINKTILIALDKSHVFVETNYRYISLHSITSFLFISSFLSGVFISKHFSFLLLCCPLVPPNSPPVPAQGAGHQGGEHTRCWPDSLLLLFCFEYFAAGWKNLTQGFVCVSRKWIQTHWVLYSPTNRATCTISNIRWLVVICLL